MVEREFNPGFTQEDFTKVWMKLADRLNRRKVSKRVKQWRTVSDS